MYRVSRQPPQLRDRGRPWSEKPLKAGKRDVLELHHRAVKTSVAERQHAMSVYALERVNHLLSRLISHLITPPRCDSDVQRYQILAVLKLSEQLHEEIYLSSIV